MHMVFKKQPDAALADTILATLIDDSRVARDANALSRAVEAVSDLIVLKLQAYRINSLFTQVSDGE